MSCSLAFIAMETILREVPSQVHRLPDSIREKINQHFFSFMFVSMGERAEELALILQDPFADEDERAEMREIIATFGSITADFEIRQVDGEEASLGLIRSVSDFKEVLDDGSFQTFLAFLESVVLLFLDDSFIMPSPEDFDVDYQIYVLRQALDGHI
jgi:hypothetical protein